MDVKRLEGALTEVGKAFRLCRLYPATHPSVQQALGELAVALPAVTALGAVELRVGTAGFLLGARPIGGRNPQLQEMASLLYAQGYRLFAIEPGVTADEFAALIRMTGASGGRGAQSLGVQGRMQPLPHLRLESSGRKSSAPRTAAAEPARAVEAAGGFGRRSMHVFRPDAMPTEIEASRVATLLEHAAPAEAPRHLARAAELAAELLAQRDVSGYARLVASLAAWARRTDDVAASSAARKGLDAAVSGAGMATLVARLSDAGAAAAERDSIAQTLGALGARAIGHVADAFVAAAPEHRDLLMAVVRMAGDAAVHPLINRVDEELLGEPARALALLLGGTRSPGAAVALGKLARHPEAPVRAAAIAGLARISASEAERLVVTALRDTDAGVRVAAARGIAWFGDPAVVPVVLAHLGNEEEPEVLVALVGTLGELRDPRSVNPLAELARGISGVFQRHPPPVRAAAVRALAAIGSADALAHVASFRSDRSAEVRLAAEGMPA